VAGYIIEQLGYLPKPGETPEVDLPQCTLKVQTVHNTRIETVHLTLKTPVDVPDAAEEKDQD